jgi:hypothetical protein
LIFKSAIIRMTLQWFNNYIFISVYMYINFTNFKRRFPFFIFFYLT